MNCTEFIWTTDHRATVRLLVSSNSTSTTARTAQYQVPTVCGSNSQLRRRRAVCSSHCNDNARVCQVESVHYFPLGFGDLFQLATVDWFTKTGREDCLWEGGVRLFVFTVLYFYCLHIQFTQWRDGSEVRSKPSGRSYTFG